jgi:putative resolvase
MKLSQYAKKAGVTSRTAFRWWQQGQIKGYQFPSGKIVVTEGEDISNTKFLALLEDQRVSTIVVEHKDRATRFGFRYLETLLRSQGRTLEVVNLAENNREELLADLVSIVYSFAARLYGQRRAKRKTEAIVKQLQEAVN